MFPGHPIDLHHFTQLSMGIDEKHIHHVDGAHSLSLPKNQLIRREKSNGSCFFTKGESYC